jgi:hypothetical protein
LAGWLRAHKDWWDKGLKNVPQQIAAALDDESFYTQAMSTDAAVVNFGPSRRRLQALLQPARSAAAVVRRSNQAGAAAAGGGDGKVA